MAPACKQPVDDLRPYLQGVAKRVADELWGPQGPAWGTTLTALEDVALAAREIFTQQLLELGLERQAAARQQQPAPSKRCPDCARALADEAEPAGRTMQTRAGEVYWQEPQEYCSRCRRAFFPSEPKSGR